LLKGQARRQTGKTIAPEVQVRKSRAMPPGEKIKKISTPGLIHQYNAQNGKKNF
jgi:hypothetical protein